MMIRLTKIHDNCYIYINTQHIQQIHPRDTGSYVYTQNSPVLEVHEKPHDIAILCGSGYLMEAKDQDGKTMRDKDGNTLFYWKS